MVGAKDIPNRARALGALSGYVAMYFSFNMEKTVKSTPA
jgi:hypothetical protein